MHKDVLDIVDFALIMIASIINIWMAYRNYKESTKLLKEREKLNKEKLNLALTKADQLDYKAVCENLSKKLEDAYDYITYLRGVKNKDD